MSGAVDYLAGLDGGTGAGIGVVGFCMGGMLAFIIAANRPDKIKAAGAVLRISAEARPNPTGRSSPAKVRGHMAENDDFFPPDGARALETKLRALGKDVTMTVHPGTGHAFMGPHNALGNPRREVAAQIWPRVAFLHETLD